jgi:hypothetical protein
VGVHGQMTSFKAGDRVRFNWDHPRLDALLDVVYLGPRHGHLQGKSRQDVEAGGVINSISFHTAWGARVRGRARRLRVKVANVRWGEDLEIFVPVSLLLPESTVWFTFVDLEGEHVG